MSRALEVSLKVLRSIEMDWERSAWARGAGITGVYKELGSGTWHREKRSYFK
jgi:hypothetical protein